MNATQLANRLRHLAFEASKEASYWPKSSGVRSELRHLAHTLAAQAVIVTHGHDRGEGEALRQVGINRLTDAMVARTDFAGIERAIGKGNS